MTAVDRVPSEARAHADIDSAGTGDVDDRARARSSRLLFVSTRFLFPADSGGKIRTRDVLRGLKGGAFDIELLSPAPEHAASRFGRELGEVCDRFVAWPESERGLGFKLRRAISIGSQLPVAVASDRSRLGARAVAAALTDDIDLIVVDFPHAALLLPPKLATASLLFTHNVEAEIFRRHAEVATGPLRRALWVSQARKMAAFEASVARQFDAVVTVSDRDARHFAAVVGEDAVVAIPTGVDLDYFAASPLPPPPSASGGVLVFTGSMDWLANRDAIRHFIDSIWPRIASARPQAEMVVVGHSPPRELVGLVHQRGLRIRFTGFVEDVREPVREAHVYVIPLRVGGGTRMKAFEAMALGRPIVSTTIGVEGLPVESGTHALLADDAGAFAAAVLRLLDRPDLGARLARAARELVETRYSYRTAARVFEGACQTAVARRRKTQGAAGIPRAA